MTKAEVITKVAETTGITKKDTGAMVDAFLQVITNELASGGKVAFTGFGSFSVVERAARECRNPQTGVYLRVVGNLKCHFPYSCFFGENWNSPLLFCKVNSQGVEPTC